MTFKKLADQIEDYQNRDLPLGFHDQHGGVSYLTKAEHELIILALRGAQALNNLNHVHG